MNRALPLILVAAAAGGALAFFALSDGAQPGPPAPAGTGDAVRPATAPNPAPRSTGPVDLAAPTPVAARHDDRATDGRADWLEIMPMNERGQALAEAAIVAVRGKERLEGTGRTRWDDLRAGEWTITVTAPDLPTWERTLVIGNGEKRREAARLSEELRIEGIVLDVYGEPLAKTQIYLLPEGKTHPDRGEIATVRDEKGKIQTGPTNGAVAATTFANGRFKATLPSPGTWRVSVGMPGDPHWTERKGHELTVGGPDQVQAVVPARSQLTVVADGPTEQRPSQVSAYVYDAQYAARVAFEREERLRLDVQEADIKGQQRELKQRAMDGRGGRAGKAGTDEGGDGDGLDTAGGKDAAGDFGASQKELNQRAYDERMAELEAERAGMGRGDAVSNPLFEDGWRPVGSARFDADGKAVLMNLPSAVDVRFLFVRGRERITTAVGTRLGEGTRSIGQVELPPPTPDSQQITTRQGEGRLRVSADADADAARLEPGVWWS